MIKERRRHARLRLPLEAFYRLAPGEEWREGTIETLGAGGAALICDVEVPVGARIDGVRFEIGPAGSFEAAHFEVAAEVVQGSRQDHPGRPPSYVHGLRFSELEKTAREHLRQFVFQQLTGAVPPKPAAAAGREEVEPETTRAALGRMLGRAAAREAKLRHRVRKLEAQLSQARPAAAEPAAGEIEQLQQRAAELEAALAEADARRTGGDEARAELEAGLRRAQEESADLRQQWQEGEERLRTELARLREEHAGLGGRLDEAAAAAESLRAELAQAGELRVELEGRLAEHENAAAERTEELAELRAELERRSAGERETGERLDASRAREKELAERLADIVGERERLEERLSEAEAGSANLRVAVEESERARAELEEERREETEMANQLVERVEELEGTLRATEEHRDELARKLVAAADERNRLREQVETRAAMGDLGEARRKLGQELGRMSAAWSELEGGLRAAEGKVESDGRAQPPGEPRPPAAEPVESAGVEEDEGSGGPPIEPVEEEPEAEAVEESEAPAAGGFLGLARRAAARLRLGRGEPEARDEGGGGDEADEPRQAGEAGEAEPAPTGEADAASDGGLGVEETVRAWAAAWSEHRVDDYLSFYSREFTPPAESGGGSDHERPAWFPPLDGMKLAVGPISRTELAPGRVSVRFEQSVTTDSGVRRAGRTLELVREGGGWKIAAESFQDSRDPGFGAGAG